MDEDRDLTYNLLYSPGFFGLIDAMLALMALLLIVSSISLLALRMKSPTTQNKSVKLQDRTVSKSALVLPNAKRIIIPNELNGRVFFDSGRADIRSEFLPLLDGVVEEIKSALKSKEYDFVQIEGYTDEVPLRRKAKYLDNWELGAARALSVLRYLQEQTIPPQLLSAKTFGQYQPSLIGDEVDNSLRAKRRRIEIVLIKDIRKDAP